MYTGRGCKGVGRGMSLGQDTEFESDAMYITEQPDMKLEPKKITPGFALNQLKSLVFTAADFAPNDERSHQVEQEGADFIEPWAANFPPPHYPSLSELNEVGKHWTELDMTSTPYMKRGDCVLWLNGDRKGKNGFEAVKEEFFNGRIWEFGHDLRYPSGAGMRVAVV